MFLEDFFLKWNDLTFLKFCLFLKWLHARMHVYQQILEVGGLESAEHLAHEQRVWALLVEVGPRDDARDAAVVDVNSLEDTAERQRIGPPEVPLLMESAVVSEHFQVHLLSDINCVQVTHPDGEHTHDVEPTWVESKLGILVAVERAPDSLVREPRCVLSQLGEVARKVIPRPSNCLVAVDVDPGEEATKR